MTTKYYKADPAARRPWARFCGMLGAFTLSDYVRHAMSAVDRQICLSDMLAGVTPPTNGSERAERITNLPAEVDGGFETRKSLLVLAADAAAAAGLAQYLGVISVSAEDVAEYNAFVSEEYDPARVDDPARPSAVKAAHVRSLFAPAPSPPFGVPLGDASTKGGKRSKR